MKKIIYMLLVFLSLEAFEYTTTCRIDDGSKINLRVLDNSIIVNNKYKVRKIDSSTFIKDDDYTTINIYKNKAYTYKISHFGPTNYEGIYIENIYGKKSYGICAHESWFKINKVYDKSTYKNWF